MPPFQTWEQIEQQISQGGDSELWDSLYLTMDQVAQLLRDVKRYAAYPFIHPMFAVPPIRELVVPNSFVRNSAISTFKPSSSRFVRRKGYAANQRLDAFPCLRH